MVSLHFAPRKLFACAALICSLILCATAGRMSERAPVSALPEEQTLKSYLAAYGWEVDMASAVWEEVELPEAFDDSYRDYLAAQHECGFYLEGYAGQCVRRWSCSVTNYPTGDENVTADLLLYEGQVVGGDIRCNALSGFLHSLRYPE